MPARCSSFRPRPSRMWKRLRVSPCSEMYRPPSVSTPSMSKKATRTPWAASSSPGGNVSTGVDTGSDHLGAHQVVAVDRAAQALLPVDHQQPRDAALVHQLGRLDREHVFADRQW